MIKKKNVPDTAGWRPSRKALIDLLRFAPDEWYDELASIAVREGLFSEPPDWKPDIERGGKTLSQLEKAAAQVAQEGGIGQTKATLMAASDLGRIWQLIVDTDQATYSHFFATLDAPIESTEDARRFLSGELNAVIKVSNSELELPVSGPALYNALWRAAPSLGRGFYSAPPPVFQDEVEQRMWALETIDEWLSASVRGAQYRANRKPLPDLDDVPPSGFHGATVNGEPDEGWLEEAMLIDNLAGGPTGLIARERVVASLPTHLEYKGHKRGPCPRCGRPWWLVAEPRPKGRPPLINSYCSSCVGAIKREQSADRMKRARERRLKA